MSSGESLQAFAARLAEEAQAQAQPLGELVNPQGYTVEPITNVSVALSHIPQDAGPRILYHPAQEVDYVTAGGLLDTHPTADPLNDVALVVIPRGNEYELMAFHPESRRGAGNHSLQFDFYERTAGEGIGVAPAGSQANQFLFHGVLSYINPAEPRISLMTFRSLDDLVPDFCRTQPYLEAQRGNAKRFLGGDNPLLERGLKSGIDITRDPSLVARLA